MIEASTDSPNSDQSSYRFPRCARIISVKHDASFYQTIKRQLRKSEVNSRRRLSIQTRIQNPNQGEIQSTSGRCHGTFSQNSIRIEPQSNRNIPLRWQLENHKSTADIHLAVRSPCKQRSRTWFQIKRHSRSRSSKQEPKRRQIIHRDVSSPVVALGQVTARHTVN